MLSWIPQIFAVTALNLRTLGQRLGSSLVAMVGIAGVVVVLVAVLSIAEGFQQTLAGTGSDDTAIVLRGGSTSEMTSGLTLENTRVIADAPGVERISSEAGGTTVPAASAELFVIINLPKISTGTDANVPLRGVGPEAFAVRPDVKIVAGRNFEPGRNEIIAGEGASRQFEGLEPGNTLRLGQAEWKVVGVFSSGGTVADSELWTDARVLQPAYRRGNTFQSVYAKLSSADDFQEFKDSLTTDPRLNVEVQRESDYYAGQSQTLSQLIRVLGWLIAAFMGLGAVIAALITMYSAVAARRREIATLRALGFKSVPVVISVLTEALLLALVGGCLGAAAAYLVFNGYQAATLNWQTFSQVTFAFAVTPPLVIQGIVYSLILGFFGGLLPAIKAARMPIAIALREA
ncbi:MAG: ABC transporter permease [Acidobacteriota bacterium]|nr:ABC transporter permease [Acidobacteriota bacterium]